MLKSPGHDTGRNTNFSGKRFDRLVAEIRFSHKLAKLFRPYQRIRRELVRLFLLPGQFRADLVIIDKGLFWMKQNMSDLME